MLCPNFFNTIRNKMIFKRYLVDILVVCVDAYVKINNVSIMPGQSHRFLGITSTFRGVNVS